MRERLYIRCIDWNHGSTLQWQWEEYCGQRCDHRHLASPFRLSCWISPLCLTHALDEHRCTHSCWHR